MSDLEIVPATEADIEAICSILVEAATWLKERGTPMWRVEELTVEKVLPAVQRGEFHLAYLAGEAVGTIIYQEEDTFFWPDVPGGESAFIHRVAVRRNLAGRGLAHAMIQWAENKARKQGKKYLRLDTDAKRPRLCNVYESYGFVRHSERQMGTFAVARYEIVL